MTAPFVVLPNGFVLVLTLVVVVDARVKAAVLNRERTLARMHS